MNFSPELSAFQGVILSADNVHQFSRLSVKGGNEDQINYVVNSIFAYLEQHGFLTNGEIPKDKVSQVRIFGFYIVLNADLPVLEDMVEMPGIDSVIWTVPTIPKCLMCELMWNLHMEKFIYELIAYTHPMMALELSSAFIDNFKYFEPLKCLEQLKLLLSACYTFICRLALFNFELVDLSNTTKAAYNNFFNCLRFFTSPPNGHKLNRLSKDERYKYLGKRLYAMFLLTNECFTKFTGRLDPQLPVTNFYELTYKDGSLVKNIPSQNICELTNNVLKECFSHCHETMLDTCKDLVMDVSVDVFCCWSEIEENGKSMQQTIGELCYIVRNRLVNIPIICDHPLVSMLEQITRKPVEMQDMINVTDNNDIIEKIKKNNDESKAWIQALAHKNNISSSIKLLNIIESNLDKYNDEELHKLYITFNSHINSENKDYVEGLAIKVFQQCNLQTKYNILDEHFNNNNFVNMRERADFTNSMTEIFNKLIVSPDADLTDVLTVFLQNPQQVYTKIFVVATESAQQTNIMLKVMKLLAKYSDYYYSNETEPCIVRITQEVIDNVLDTDVQQNNFVKFICGLKDANIISSSKLLLLIIMTNMHKSLLNKDIKKIFIQVKLLQEAYSLQELIEYRAPMLAMIAQVLDVLRWKINTYTAVASLALEAALVLQKSLLGTYNGHIPDNESRWLKSKLINIQPLNMYYYKELWNPPGNNYLEVISAMKVNKNISLEELTSWLSQVICTCIQQEWYDIWDSLIDLDNCAVLKTFRDSLAMITLAEKTNRTDNTWACMLHCYKNYIMIIRYKYLNEPLTDIEVREVIFNLSMLAELITEDKMEEFGAIVMPLFGYLSERKNDFSIDFTEYLHECVKHTPLSPLVNKNFLNGSV